MRETGGHGPGQYLDADAAKVIRIILKAIGYMHAVGIVHWNLNTDNIMIEYNSIDDPKLTDFINSRWMDSFSEKINDNSNNDILPYRSTYHSTYDSTYRAAYHSTAADSASWRIRATAQTPFRRRFSAMRRDRNCRLDEVTNKWPILARHLDWSKPTLRNHSSTKRMQVGRHKTLLYRNNIPTDLTSVARNLCSLTLLVTVLRHGENAAWVSKHISCIRVFPKRVTSSDVRPVSVMSRHQTST